MSTAPSVEARRGAKRLRWYNYLAYGGGDTANNLAFSLAMSFLPLYLTDIGQISPATVGAIFLAMRFVDAITDVVMGSIIDRTSTRFGKFRPWILGGSIPLVVLAILNFSMPSGLYGTTGGLIWAVVMYFLMGSVAYTAVNIPYGSLAAAMTDNTEERSRLALFRMLGTALMQVTLAVAIAPAINEFQGDPNGLQAALYGILIPLGVVAIVLYAFLFFTSKETVERKVAKVTLSASLKTIASNKALQMLSLASVLFLVGLFAANGLFTYYSRDVLGNANTLIVIMVLVSGMVFVTGWFIPPLSKRFGKPRLFQVGSLIGALGGLCFFLADGSTIWLAFFGAGLFGLASASVNTLMWNMEADSVEYGEWATGVRNEGTTYAVFSFIRKLSQAIGGFVGLQIIDAFGYDGKLEQQTASAQTGIAVAVGIIPLVFMALAMIAMHFYPMSDAKHKAILLDLQTRSAGEDEALADHAGLAGERRQENPEA